MASTNCWRCLARPSQRLLLAPVFGVTSAPASAAFTTSTQLGKVPEPSMTKHIRAGKKLSLRRNKRTPDKTKPPLPGERKAFRKRIQLSNDNALAVTGLDVLTTENVRDPDSVGKVFGLPDECIDQLRVCEAFKSSQSWSLFRSPHMLVRKETVDLAKQMMDAIEKKETLRLVVAGNRGSGKSIVGLQALATGLLNKWVVINIPEGQELTTAATEYASIPNSEMFSQPVYTVKLMQAIYQANQSILSQHKVMLDHMHLSISVTRNMTLAGLINATKEPDFAWPVFQAFWKELLLPGRPPILFSLDGLAHIMRVSEYRSPAFELIHSHDLALLRMFTDALGGKTTFANGAAILGITSKGNAPIIPSMDKAIAQAIATQKGEKVPERDPFFRKYDERVFDSLRGVKVLDVQGVSKTEARALMEYWAASGILRSRIDEKNVSEKWTMAGGGVVAEMERVAFHDLRATT
ncbi:mitochondrial ribosomal death-associated protein 3-domain-containing protein [Xylaria bambusicola]|uniref:mitochondrial ribosomal death-associated protein 3-domain-containing protein n=1 Tax=Xylaria bambusicola TaxID=326684 RepID=UPI0020087877|nr:mitochondrial ribosomal death-associated protein 3-domain-containing protein [Xylaria bambusicola]KAI0515209.1 mitochondrial ribosomal death-associated protein 3-domain-containing protein [Xylaria bambusicola]